MTLFFALMACAPSAELALTLDIVDEQGLPVVDAQLIAGRDTWFADDGTIRLTDLQGPVSGVVSAAGHLSEPVLFGRDDHRTTRTVRLWDDTRWALHAGGDVMLGRRYVEDGGPLAVDEALGAVSVVSDLAPLFSVADVSVVNLESVLSDLPMSGAYPGKLYVINTPTRAVSGLTALGVDVVGLANNHTRDWLDDGLARTRAALIDNDIRSVGGHERPDGADVPVIVEVGGVRVGFVAYTTLSGSFVNDAYPTEDTPLSADPDLSWQFERREWAFDGDGWSVPLGERRIGTAWRVFSEAESELSAGDTASAWASLVGVYPELQDWVARRGHGGAAAWSDDAVDTLLALEDQVDVTVMQLHGGYELSTAPSVEMRRVCEAAAEAGADLIIGHHPHVLHGAEWANDTLVVHSLGNLVFEQANPLTRASVMLRTVWSSDTLLEARLLPLELIDDRPVPVTDLAATRTLRRVAEVTAAHRESVSVQGELRAVESDAWTTPARVALDGHTATLGRDATVAEAVTVRVSAGQVADLPHNALVSPHHDADDLWIGRDLFGWGHFEDVAADSLIDAGIHWFLDSEWETVPLRASARDGDTVLRLERDVFNDTTVTTRSDGQLSFVDHRLWDGDTPVDPDARYAVRLRGKMSGQSTASLRLEGLSYDRGSLAVDPVTVELYDVDIPLSLGSSWTDVLVPIDSEWLTSGVNRVRPSLRLAPPERGTSVLHVDAVQVLELRATSGMPSTPGAWDVLWNDSDDTIEATLSTLPLTVE